MPNCMKIDRIISAGVGAHVHPNSFPSSNPAAMVKPMNCSFPGIDVDNSMISKQTVDM